MDFVLEGIEADAFFPTGAAKLLVLKEIAVGRIGIRFRQKLRKLQHALYLPSRHVSLGLGRVRLGGH